MYQTLYRKYRPMKFSGEIGVVGQPYIVRALKNQIKTGQTGHAYLFTGVRGTGKTTCARIFAKAVNCEHPEDGEPCCKCRFCEKARDDSLIDICEIDGASNNGVEQIRALRDEVAFAPAEVKYRVYIIDEVHMLTGPAFNALLKTLEEPPPHVKFILATTEIHKVPMTVQSRCQRFDFRRIGVSEIAERLMLIARREGLDLTEDGAAVIAGGCDGALRDAISALELCSAGGERLDAESVGKILGIAGGEYIRELASAAARADFSGAVGCFERIYADGIDPERLCGELLMFYREMLLEKIGASQEESRYTAGARETAPEYTYRQIAACMDELKTCIDQLGRSGSPRLDAEVTVIKLCRIMESSAGGTPAEREEKPVPAAESPKPVTEAAKPAAETPKPVIETPKPAVETPKPVIETPKPAAETPKPGAQTTEEFAGWDRVMDYIEATDPTLAAVLEGCRAFRKGDSLCLYSEKSGFRNLLSVGGASRRIRPVIEKLLGEGHGIGRITILRSLPKYPQLEKLAAKLDELDIEHTVK